MTRFLLVRHGESTWNAVRRWQGQADPPLSERGEGQARAAVQTVGPLGPFSAIVTSTLRRARRTGDLLGTGLSMPVAGEHADLSERAAGAWEGLTRDEIEDRYPGFLAAGSRPDGYEPDPAVVERSSRALAALAGRHGESSLLVVSHGGVINALERHDGEAWRRLGNLEGRWFEVGTTGPNAGEVRAVGDRVHLVR